MGAEYQIKGKLQNCYSCKHDVTYAEQLKGLSCNNKKVKCKRTEDGGLSGYAYNGSIYKNGISPVVFIE